jgi:uncharacterized protein (TIRG00374 family)
LFVYVVDAPRVWRILRELQPAYLLLAVVVVTLDRALMTFKWNLLLKAQGYHLPLLRGMVIYCAAMLWGSVLPGTVGADAIRAVLVTRRGVRGPDAVASIIVERVVGFVAALVLGIASLVILRATGVLDATYDRAVYLGGGLLAVTIGLIGLSLSPAAQSRAPALLPRSLVESKPIAQLRRMTGAYQSLAAARGTIARFAGLTLAEQIFGVTLPWTLARGLGVAVDALVLLGVVRLCMLISRLPISVDGLGVFEAIFIGLMLLAGISAEASLAIALTGRVIQLVCFLPWWLAQVTNSGGIGPPEQKLGTLES